MFSPIQYTINKKRRMNYIEKETYIASRSSSSIPASTQKHVRFSEHVQVSNACSPLDLLESSEEWTAIWYRVADLGVFRNEVREMCTQIRLLDKDVTLLADTTTTAGGETRLPSLARGPLTRGLEQRSCPERQRRKYLTTRFILKAASKLQHVDPIKLANVAHKCTRWATEVAVEEAARDYFRAWNDHQQGSSSRSVRRKLVHHHQQGTIHW